MDSKEMATLMIALTELQKDEVKGNIEEQAKAMGMNVLQHCIRASLLPVPSAVSAAPIVAVSVAFKTVILGAGKCMLSVPCVIEPWALCYRINSAVLVIPRFACAYFVVNLLRNHFRCRSDGRDDQDDASGHLACDGPGHSRV